jgi:hypothetical protein
MPIYDHIIINHCGSNLPPGVSDADIPGNRLEDIEPARGGADPTLVKQWMSDMGRGKTILNFGEWLRNYKNR